MIVKTALANYGQVQQGSEYRVIFEGKDFYNIICGGSPLFVFKYVFDRD